MYFLKGCENTEIEKHFPAGGAARAFESLYKTGRDEMDYELLCEVLKGDHSVVTLPCGSVPVAAPPTAPKAG